MADLGANIWTGVGLSLHLWLWHQNWRTVPWRMIPIFLAINVPFLALALATDDYPRIGGVGIVTALWLWAIWKRRPPRKRRKSKTMATIRNLGHRLVTE